MSNQSLRECCAPASWVTVCKRYKRAPGGLPHSVQGVVRYDLPVALPMARAVAHVGPDPHLAGGMQAVIGVLVLHSVGGPSTVVRSTGAPPSSSSSPRRERIGMAVRAARSVWRLPRTTIVHGHLSEGGSFLREGGLLLLARRRGMGTAMTIHGANFESFASAHPRVVAQVLRSTDLILTLTPATTGVVLRLAPAANVHQVINPVELDRDPSPAGEQSPTILFAGEVGRRKGADVLLAAWPLVRAAVPDAMLRLVGPRTDLVVESLPGVTVSAPVDRARLREMIRSSRGVVLPSRAEALPMVLLEAGASARPFVSTPVGDIETLAGAGGGRTVAVDDVEGLARHIVGVLLDPVCATAVGQAGWNECRNRFSTEVLDSQMRELYAAVPHA